MSKTNLYLLLLVAWILMGIYLWNKYLCGCWNDSQTTVSPNLLTNTWAIKDSTLYSASANEHFRFLRSHPEHLYPSRGLPETMNGVAQYLGSHPDRMLIIKGFYDKNEENTSVLPNLGLGRANEVKTYLNSLGVASNHLSIEGVLLNEKQGWFKNDTLFKGIEFQFAHLSNANNRLETIKNRLLGKPITLYFGLNEKAITLSDGQRNDFADLIFYLDNTTDGYLEVGGHTDNLGKKGVNEYLSLERANFVKDYLTTNGNINPTKINTRGYGDAKPIVPNTTKQNKALNRRVEVILF